MMSISWKIGKKGERQDWLYCAQILFFWSKFIMRTRKRIVSSSWMKPKMKVDFYRYFQKWDTFLQPLWLWKYFCTKIQWKKQLKERNQRKNNHRSRNYRYFFSDDPENGRTRLGNDWRINFDVIWINFFVLHT